MIGSVISHYRIFEMLGEGGMGVVYNAHDTKLDRIVALKFLPANIISSGEEIDRFQQEAKAISALNHPNIATIFDTDEADRKKSLALEFIVSAGKKKEADTELDTYIQQNSEGSAYQIGEIYAYRGGADKAIERLECAYKQRDGGL